MINQKTHDMQTQNFNIKQGNKHLLTILSITLIILGSSPCIYSNSPDEYGILEIVYSKKMNKDLPILVFLPESYQENGDAYEVVYFLHGTNDNEISEAGLRNMYNQEFGIQEAASVLNIIIVTPIVGNTYFMNSRFSSDSSFATYVGKELPAFIDAKFNTVNSRVGRYLAGFSMGGYGAISLLCRYPDDFSLAVSRGGVMSLSAGIDDLYWDDVSPNVVNMLGDYWSNMELYHKNGCFNMINHISERKDVGVAIEVGREDFLYKTNKRFSLKLRDMEIPYIYAEYPGEHILNYNCLISMLVHLQYLKNTVKL